MLINVKNLFVWLLFVVFGNRRRCYFGAMLPFRLPAREKQEAGSDARATILLGLKGGAGREKRNLFFNKKFAHIFLHNSVDGLRNFESVDGRYGDDTEHGASHHGVGQRAYCQT